MIYRQLSSLEYSAHISVFFFNRFCPLGGNFSFLLQGEQTDCAAAVDLKPGRRGN